MYEFRQIFSDNLTLGDKTNLICMRPNYDWVTNRANQLCGLAFNHTGNSQKKFLDKIIINAPKLKLLFPVKD